MSQNEYNGSNVYVEIKDGKISISGTSSLKSSKEDIKLLKEIMKLLAEKYEAISI